MAGAITPAPAKGMRKISPPSEVIFDHSPPDANRPLKLAQPIDSTTPHHTPIQPKAKRPCMPSAPGSSAAPMTRQMTEMARPTANQPRFRRKAVPSNSFFSARSSALRAVLIAAWLVWRSAVLPEGSAV